MSKIFWMLLFGSLIVCAVVFAFGIGFGSSGGEIRTLSPETTTYATAGDNSVVIASNGDGNEFSVTYSNRETESKPEPKQSGSILLSAFGVVVLMLVSLVLYFLLFQPSGETFL